jgi:hypothetical protein
MSAKLADQQLKSSQNQQPEITRSAAQVLAKSWHLKSQHKNNKGRHTHQPEYN